MSGDKIPDHSCTVDNMHNLAFLIEYSGLPIESDGMPIGCPGFVPNDTENGCRYLRKYPAGTCCSRDPNDMAALREIRAETCAREAAESQDLSGGEGYYAKTNPILTCVNALRRIWEKIRGGRKG